MAIEFISTSAFGSGVRRIISVSDSDIHLLAGVTLGSTTTDAIQVNANDVSIHIDGTLAAAERAIDAGSFSDVRVVVGRTGVVNSTNSSSNDVCIVFGGNGDLVNHGLISSPETTAVIFGGENAEAFNTGTIAGTAGVQFQSFGGRLINHGDIFASGSFDGSLNNFEGAGVVVDADNTRIFNGAEGRIYSTAPGGAGVRLNSSSAGTVVENHGEIVANAGIGVEFSPVFSGQFVLLNYGLVSGRFSSFAGSAFEDRVTNGGLMQGDVLLNEGADLYLGLSGGTVKGTVYGGTGNDTLTGADADDVLDGGADDDVLSGGNGDDTLDGGAGIDSLIGGLGHDVFVTDGVDTIMELANEGLDTVLSSASVTLGANLENLTLTGSASINGTGNAGSNQITGNSGNNTLNGGGGSDTMLGGSGNDTYVTDGGDAITETAGQGTDTVISSINFTLTANFENLVLTGTASLSGTGNALNNRLTGNSGNNSLNGATGADVMRGGSGNDTYVTDGGDTITENASQGLDTVVSSVSLRLGANLENLVLVTGTTAINGTGNTLANTITGNSGTNTVNGGLGNDNLTGGAGTDSFVFNTALGASNIDRITDFNVNGETIRLENTGIFTTLAGGTLSVAAFVRNTSGNAADASDRIIYETDNGRLYFDRDGTGGAAKVHFATLNTNLAINNADFFVF